MVAFQNLAAVGVIRKTTARRVEYYRSIRNRLVHGEGDPRELLDEKTFAELGSLREEVEQLLDKS